jgi:plastocyanin
MSVPATARSDRILLGAAVFLLLVPIGAFGESAYVDIAQRGIRFSQTELTVHVGETVRYHNQDDVTHNLMVLGPDGDPEDEGLQPRGATVTKTFDEAGFFQVRCAIHPRMKMTVTVTK